MSSGKYGSELPAGSTLPSGEHLVSKSNTYKFVNQQDGNLCIYRDSKATWASGTWNKGKGNVELLVDGNLAFYDSSGTGKPIWASMSQGITKAPGPYTLIMQDDGNLVIYGAKGVPTWASQSDKSSGLFINAADKTELTSGVSWLEPYQKLVSSNGKYSLKFVNQADGNLVVYDQNSKATWSSGSWHKGAGNLYMQADGNLVLYDTTPPYSGAVVWASNTFKKGTNPYKLIMQNDGNLVIYDSNSQPTWATNTGA